jgi:hypothetical protein
MGKPRRRLCWDSAERAVTYLATLACEVAKLVDALRKIL